MMKTCPRLYGAFLFFGIFFIFLLFPPNTIKANDIIEGEYIVTFKSSSSPEELRFQIIEKRKELQKKVNGSTLEREIELLEEKSTQMNSVREELRGRYLDRTIEIKTTDEEKLTLNLLQVDKTTTQDTVRSLLLQLSEVVDVFPNYVIQKAQVPNDTYYALQWG
ncbi:unnamed protein product, partial [marine sediment metagenome]